MKRNNSHHNISWNNYQKLRKNSPYSYQTNWKIPIKEAIIEREEEAEAEGEGEERETESKDNKIFTTKKEALVATEEVLIAYLISKAMINILSNQYRFIKNSPKSKSIVKTNLSFNQQIM